MRKLLGMTATVIKSAIAKLVDCGVNTNTFRMDRTTKGMVAQRQYRKLRGIPTFFCMNTAARHATPKQIKEKVNGSPENLTPPLGVHIIGMETKRPRRARFFASELLLRGFRPGIGAIT